MIFWFTASTASAVAGLAWCAFFFPFIYCLNSFQPLTRIHKLSTCIFANSAFGFILQDYLRHEAIGEGITWSALFEITDNDIPIGFLIGFLLMDSLIYLLLALYIEQINPGTYGIPRPWYFLFSSSFWNELTDKSQVYTDNTVEYIYPTPGNSVTSFNLDSNGIDDKFFEEEPNLFLGIEIRNLRKVYKKDRVAVDSLTLNMYENQITVLLGQNGAGKTTTMSMLTGIYALIISYPFII